MALFSWMLIETRRCCHSRRLGGSAWMFGGPTVLTYFLWIPWRANCWPTALIRSFERDALSRLSVSHVSNKRAAECRLWVATNRLAATEIISCPSFESAAVPGSKNTLNEMSGVLDAWEGIPETLALPVKMRAVAQRRCEILGMASTPLGCSGITR